MNNLNNENYEVLSLYLVICLFTLYCLIKILKRTFISFTEQIKLNKQPYDTLRELDLETQFSYTTALQFSNQFRSNNVSFEQKIDQQLQNTNLTNYVKQFLIEQQLKFKFDQKKTQFYVQLPKQNTYSKLTLIDIKNCQLKLKDQLVQQRIKTFIIDYPLKEQLPIYLIQFDQNINKCIIINQQCISLNQYMKQQSNFIKLEPEPYFIEQILIQTLKYLYKMNQLNYWHNQISSNNIFIDQEKIYIGNVTSLLFNDKVDLKYQHLKNKSCKKFKINEEIDVLQFGHLMYELYFNHQYPGLFPQINDFSFLQKKTIETMNLIFKSRKKPDVNLAELLQFFKLEPKKLQDEIPIQLIQNQN